MSARSIAVPVGADIRLCIRPPHHVVVVAPPPLRADLDALLTKPSVVGLFAHSDGARWPDRSGCRSASEYLKSGHVVVLPFESLADALAAQKRLSGSVVTP